MQLDRTARRIVGSLLEKRFTTPEQYPLTLNALVLACNQKSNRDPVVELAEFEVEGCLRQLRVDGWVTIVERDYGRAVRYSERFVEQIGLTTKEAAILTELMLRGPQTEQELERRCERMVPLGSVEETTAVLNALAERKLVAHLSRESGQRHARWRHLLAPPGEEAVPAAGAAPPAPTEAETLSGAALPARPATEATTRILAPGGAPTTGAVAAAAIAALAEDVATLRAEVGHLQARVEQLERAASSAPPGPAT
jgi:uncharacterized protein YceH (UPF0502 family)